MSTYNIAIVPNSWIKIVDVGDTDFLVTWTTPTNVMFAATEVDEQPTVDGHLFPREKRITREDVGTGYVWAKLASTGIVSSMQLVVSKTPSIVGSTGGFDMNERVHKVAMLVWNSSLLSWERGTATGGGSGGSVAEPMTKRFDKHNATELYVGNAALGTAESAPGWGIQKVTFDVSGNATASFYGVGAWTSRYSLSYA